MDDDLYDERGDERLSPNEVKILKQFAQTGLVARYLFAALLGALSLIAAVWGIAEHIDKR